MLSSDSKVCPRETASSISWTAVLSVLSSCACNQFSILVTGKMARDLLGKNSSRSRDGSGYHPCGGRLFHVPLALGGFPLVDSASSCFHL